MNNCDTVIANDVAQASIHEAAQQECQDQADQFWWYAFMSDVSNFVYYEVMAEGCQMAADAEGAEVDRLLAEIDDYQQRENTAFDAIINAEDDITQAENDIQAAQSEKVAALANYNRLSAIFSDLSGQLFSAQSEVERITNVIKASNKQILGYEAQIVECQDWLNHNPDEATWLQNGSPSGDLPPPAIE